MTKYRVRLKNGRVIGPFLETQLYELKMQSHIDGTEDAQIFPTGDWKPLKTFEFYENLMDENRTIINTPKEEMTFVIDLNKIRAQQNNAEIDKMNVTSNLPIQDLTETVRITTPNQNKKEDLDSSKDNNRTLEIALDIEKENFDSDRTLINPVAQEEIQKLRRIQKIEEEKLQQETERKENDKKAQQQLTVPEDEPISSHDATRVFKMDLVPVDILSVANEAELNIEKEAKSYRAKKRARELKSEESEEEFEEETKPDKKKKILIVLAVLLIGYVFLFPEDKSSKKEAFRHVETQISFPIPYDKADLKKSQVQLDAANKSFLNGTYVSLIESGLYYKQAFENDLENSFALNMMIRVYAEELKFSKEKTRDSVTLFNLIQSKRPFLVQDPNGVIGMNLFYSAINKHEAAADIVAKYLKLKPTNVTPDLFAVYLQSLMKLGRIDTSKQFYRALTKSEDKNRYALNALADYAILNEEWDEAMLYIDDGLKKYPKLVNFHLRKAELLIKDKKFDSVLPYLQKAEELNLEFNDHYRARFLQSTGILLAYKGKNQTATEFLAKSLQIEDSTELRMRLADLSISDQKTETNNLISESKAIKYLLLAKDFFEKRNYELALSNASKASDEVPGFVPAELFLAKVQLRLGLASQALKTLTAVKDKHSDNKEVNLALIEGYIDTYKFNEAQNRIAIISNLEQIKSSPEFASINAKLYIKMGDSLQAISWLQNSISMNPLNDRDIYYLAEILIKRANFDAAKTLLNKCMELDPIEPDYRIAYSKIIYEIQDDQAAVGYLLGLLEEFHDDPKILSEIAIFYYRAGKVKDFEAFREKIEKVPNKDKSLYEFLIRASLLDERYEDIPPLVEKLISIEPGDLEAMMTAGRVLFETGKLVDSAKWFKRIQDKLETYPKVQYYIAKIKFLSKDYDQALEVLDKDLAANGDNDQSLTLKAQIYVEKNNLVEAENLFKKAQKLNPRSYESLMGLADISTKRNNFDLALDLYKKAMSQKGDEPIIHKKIGDVYRLLGQGTLAIESYKMYLEMKPEAPDRGTIQNYINVMK